MAKDTDEDEREHQTICVQLPGKAIELIGQSDLEDLLRTVIELDGKVTRIDLAVDFLNGSQSRLIDQPHTWL
ncbi:MAG: hypothetical protein AAFY46_16530, partial [Planctomycetota bacterium]